MLYYNQKCEKKLIDISKLEYLESAAQADVFTDYNIIFKRYYNNECDKNARLNLKVLNILKTIKNPHIIKI